MHDNIIFQDATMIYKTIESIGSDRFIAESTGIQYKLIFPIRGNAECLSANKRYELMPGVILFAPPMHGYRLNIKSIGQFEYCVFRFSERKIPTDLLSEIEGKSGCYLAEGGLIQTLLTEFGDRLRSYNGNWKEKLFDHMLCEVLYCFCDECKPCAFNESSRTVTDTIEYIDKNISENFTLKDICRHIKCSESLLCQSFANNMGVSVMQYVRTKRILLARSFIEKGMRPLETYTNCGFSDYSTFYRSFRKVLGRAPRQPAKTKR